MSKAKSGFSIKHTKTARNFSYYGDLKEAIDKAEKEYSEKLNNVEKRKFLLWTYERAKKELEAWDRRISDLGDFISLAKDALKKQGGGGDSRW